MQWLAWMLKAATLRATLRATFKQAKKSQLPELQKQIRFFEKITMDQAPIANTVKVNKISIFFHYFLVW
jgi:hypothetical protein